MRIVSIRKIRVYTTNRISIGQRAARSHQRCKHRLTGYDNSNCSDRMYPFSKAGRRAWYVHFHRCRQARDPIQGTCSFMHTDRSAATIPTKISQKPHNQSPTKSKRTATGRLSNSALLAPSGGSSTTSPPSAPFMADSVRCRDAVRWRK